jgi:hypothetical protein
MMATDQHDGRGKGAKGAGKASVRTEGRQEWDNGREQTVRSVFSAKLQHKFT